MKVIGLTGGIGSGKSTVAEYLAELGAVIIDTDKVGHECMKPDTEGFRRVTETFGEQVITDDGLIDRKILGEIVFANPDALARLEAILHPLIRDAVAEVIEDCRDRNSVSMVVLEVPLLVEKGWTEFTEEVWVTSAPRPAILKRLRERSGMSEEEALSRINSQATPEERLRHADVMIDTDCTLEELREKVQQLWQQSV